MTTTASAPPELRSNPSADPLLSALSQRRVIFVGGKGGVGKTTHSASLACRLAASGRKVLLISTDPAHSLGDVLQRQLSQTAQALTPHLSALELNPQEMIERHFAQVAQTIRGYAKPEMLPKIQQHLDAAKSSPGAEEAAVLEAICQHITDHRTRGFDHVVFDTAPTGHTLRLLELPQMMGAWTQGLLAQQQRQQQLREAALPFWQQQQRDQTALSDARHARWQTALQVLEKRQALFGEAGRILNDATSTSIVLVMTPEMLPLAETRRAAAQLRQFKLPCQHLIINQIMPAPAADDAPFWHQRHQRQQEILARIREDLPDLHHHPYTLQALDVRGIAALTAFGDQARMPA